VFAIDRHGRVVDRLEGASSIAEMRAGIEKALKG
jgi:glutathione peroxidase-family protein